MCCSKRKQVARQVSSCRVHEQWRGAAIAAAATGLQSCRQSVQYTARTESRRARRDEREEAAKRFGEQKIQKFERSEIIPCTSMVVGLTKHQQKRK
eukprot:4636517-Pleurochrysis_carterae.AAC.1